jgi:hypothetical protein
MNNAELSINSALFVKMKEIIDYISSKIPKGYKNDFFGAPKRVMDIVKLMDLGYILYANLI